MLLIHDDDNDDTMCVDISEEIIDLEDDSDDESSNQKVFEKENCYVTVADSDQICDYQSNLCKQMFNFVIVYFLEHEIITLCPNR